MANQVSVLKVEGMSCGHCVARVNKVVGALGGVSTVSADLAAKQVTVEFDPSRVSEQSIRDAIKEQGYEVN